MLCHLLITSNLVEELQRVLPMELTWVFPTLAGSQRYSTERTILTAHNEMVDGLKIVILSKFSGVTLTFAGCDRVVHESGKARHYVENLDAVCALQYLQILTQMAFQKEN